jgi:aminotransferase in exopolysaccharide biosynthesis
MIPLSVPNIIGNASKYIKECLDSEWVSSAGKYVDLFEKKISEYTGSKYSVACMNGTSALQVSLRLAGVEDGDEVIVPTLTFIAPVNAIVYNNATPVFMDVDIFYNIDINKTIDFLKSEIIFKNGRSFNKKTKKRISAIIPVHMWGNAVYLDELISICDDLNITMVEDASESLGTFYNSGKFKNYHTGTVGKLGCISFNGNKIITSGGGGMILTDDKELAAKARYLTTQAKDDPIRYIHDEIGYNFRLTNLQAALGVAQLEQLPVFLKHKRKIFSQYQVKLEKIIGLNLASVPNYAENNHWMNLLQIDSKIYGEDWEEIMWRLDKNDIQSRPVWALNHLQKPYKDCQSYKVKKAEECVNSSLCLPSSTNLSSENLNKVIRILKND